MGKTTLLKCLMGLIPAKTGEVIWQGKTLTHSKPHQRVQSGVAYVPQGREIFPRLTVEENLLLGLSRFSAREAKQVPEEIWQLFPVLKEMKHRRGAISRWAAAAAGDWSRAGESSAAAYHDEPTEGIQPSVIKDRPRDPHHANRGDMAILLVEQFYDFAAELADSYLLMSRGTIIQRGRGENMEQEGVRGLVAI